MSSFDGINPLTTGTKKLEQFIGLLGELAIESGGRISIGAFVRHEEMPVVKHSHGRRTAFIFSGGVMAVLKHEDGNFLLGQMDGKSFKVEQRGRQLTINGVDAGLILGGQCRSMTPAIA